MKAVHRSYRGDTLILETIFETEDGVVALIDFMPIKEQTGQVDVIRLVEGREGSVAMRMELTLRFDYGDIVPWVETYRRRLCARLADRMRSCFVRQSKSSGEDLKTLAQFTVSKGETVPFTLIRNDSRLPAPAGRRSDSPARRNRSLVEEVGIALCLRRPVSAGSRALPDHAQGSYFSSDRGNCRGAHHLASRTIGWSTQLGLSLLLAARRDLHALRVAGLRIYGRDYPPGANG